MAPSTPQAPEPAPGRRRGALASLLAAVLVVGVGLWFTLRRRDPALPAFVDEARPSTGTGTTSRPVPAQSPDAAVPEAAEASAGTPVPAAAPSVAPAAAEPEPSLAAPEPTAVPEPPDASVRTGEDLLRVQGIGRRSADALVAAGIDSLAVLATSDDAAVLAALEAAGLRRSPTLSSWAAQARRLSQA
ncbi:hypothetical protein [Jannaschia sp. R86511]|uniref:hypothetical protein n=1 Tax=Jannaschia sp. R86511 TaxID=3093853 RepID=UPI0036D381F2